MGVHEECGVFGVMSDKPFDAPPFLFPCYYGTDIDSQKNLIACHHTVPEIAKMIGADSLGFLPVQSLGKLCGGDHYCASCFDGVYPTEIPADTDKNRFEQRLSEKRGNYNDKRQKIDT